MKNIFAIAERDLKAYFTSPIAYVVLTIFLFLMGMFFYLAVTSLSQSASMRALQSAQTGQPPDPIDMPGEVMRNLLQVMVSIMLFMLPLITMALFSEEKKRGTIELLLTAPVTDIQVVLGKFLAASLFYVILLASTLVELGVLYMYSHPALGPILTGYIGVLLYGLSFVALGMFISTLTENQIIAAILTFAMTLLLWLLDGISKSAGVSGTLGAILSYLSVFQHLEDFMSGVIGTSHIIFYLSLTLVGLFLTYRSLDSLRWRG
jgi:ABC-2 type transport system permease protein